MHALQALGQIVEGWRQSMQGHQLPKSAAPPKSDLTQKVL
jgi:hypothetical protein